MNKKESEEFGMIKQAVIDIKDTVTKMDSKLDEVIKDKLDTKVFDDYLLKNRSWVHWIPTVLCAVIAIIVAVGGV